MYDDIRLIELNKIISDVIYKENQKALDSGCDVLCTATEYLTDKLVETVYKYNRDEINALRWTNKHLIKTEKEKRRELWKKAVNQFLNKVKEHQKPVCFDETFIAVDIEDIDMVAKELLGQTKE